MEQLSHQGCGTANLHQFNIKYRTSRLKTTRVLSDIKGIIIHHVIDNDYVEVQPSEYTFKCTSESFPDPDISLIKSMDYYEMDQLLELFHSEHDYDHLDFDL